jgi:hypothetical protein
MYRWVPAMGAGSALGSSVAGPRRSRTLNGIHTATPQTCILFLVNFEQLLLAFHLRVDL